MFGLGDTNRETVKEILTPPTVVKTMQETVNNQITDSVTASPKKKNNRRRKPKNRSKASITEGHTKGGSGVIKQR